MRLPLMSVIFFCLSSYFVHAQSPDKLSFQAVIRDSTGGLVLNQSVGLQMSILQGSVSGSSVYTETHSPTTNSSGLISIEIGGGTTITGAFSSIDWSNGPYYLKREVDPAGGTNYIISGTSQLMSVPYAMYATMADTVLNAPDTSSTNEIQNLSVSITGDTLYISAGNYIIVPGISDTNYPPMDIDGNNYDTVHIGTQIWMKQNLNVSRYNTGSPIPLVTGTNWKDLTTGARTYYNNDSSTNAPIYGALYNRFATMGDSICPTGWHVPTDAEWGILETYLGGSTGAGNKLKEIGTSTWNNNTGATNEVGFTARGGGYRSGSSGNFGDIKNYGLFSSLNPNPGAGNQSHMDMQGGSGNTSVHTGLGERTGISVRCLRD